jgi:hypothetical protein
MIFFLIFQISIQPVQYNLIEYPGYGVEKTADTHKILINAIKDHFKMTVDL